MREEQTECLICFNDLKERIIITLECDHKICRDCSEIWFTKNNNNTCPYCRGRTRLFERRKCGCCNRHLTTIHTRALNCGHKIHTNCGLYMITYEGRIKCPDCGYLEEIELSYRFSRIHVLTGRCIECNTDWRVRRFDCRHEYCERCRTNPYCLVCARFFDIFSEANSHE